MRLKKTVAVLLIFGLALAAIAGCGAPPDDEALPQPSVTAAKAMEGVKIAYFVSELANPFHQARAAAAQDYAFERYGAEVVIIDGESDNDVMLQNLDMLATSNYGGASLQVWHPSGVDASVISATDAGIAVTSFFGQMGGTGIPAVRNDEADAAFALGASAAQQWIKAHPGKIVYTVQLGWPDYPQIRDGRTQPFVEGVLSVVGEDGMSDLGCIAAETEKEARDAMTRLLAQNPEVNVIFCEAGGLVSGCMEVLKEEGRGKMSGGVVQAEIVVGADCSKKDLKEIYNPGSAFKMALGLPPASTSIAIIDMIAAIYTGEAAQFPGEERTELVPAFAVDYYSVTLEETLEWYNKEFLWGVEDADKLLTVQDVIN